VGGIEYKPPASNYESRLTDFGTFGTNETEKWAKVIKFAGIKAE